MPCKILTTLNIHMEIQSISNFYSFFNIKSGFTHALYFLNTWYLISQKQNTKIEDSLQLSFFLGGVGGWGVCVKLLLT